MLEKNSFKIQSLLKLENLTFFAALVGLALGLTAPEFSIQIGFFGDMFLTLLKMMIIPLILVSVFLAVAKQAKQGELSSIGLKTFIYFLASSALASLAGLLAANLLPSTAVMPGGFATYDSSKLASASFSQIVLGFFPANPIKALANGEIIQIVVFALLLGVACIRLENKKRDLLIDLSDAGHDLIMAVIQGVLYVAPLGVLSLVAAVVAKTDASSLQGLGWLFAAIASASFIHVFISLPLLGFFAGGFHPFRFMLNVKEALIVALATASSSATLPVSTKVLEERESVSPKTTGFVLPLGATLNMDGSALYQVLVVLFLGQIAGIDFSLSQQILVFVFVMLSSAGTAGIPGGGLVMMGALLQMLGIPLELIGIYLLVDRFWDAPITAINVLSDLFGTKIIDRFVRR